MIDHSVLTKIRGKYRTQTDLSKMCWFRVGGLAEAFFVPADLEDLQYLLSHKPKDIPIFTFGVGSNILIRDGGIKGLVIRLGRAFSEITHRTNLVTAGAAALDINMAKYCLTNGIGGLEFFSGIPGTIGGAVQMNAGAYGSDVATTLIEASAVNTKGEIRAFTNTEMGYSYRVNSLKEQFIFTSATFKGEPRDQDQIQKTMDEIRESRHTTQPIKSKTGGSTFKNPQGISAWRLIDEAGCRGLQIGGARVSEQHCNFFINAGHATANDLETLIEEVRHRVFTKTGISLELEIKIIGEK